MNRETKSVQIRIIFMGTSEFARDILNSMLEANLNVVSIFTKPDKKAGRNREINESPVKSCAREKNIPIFQPQNFSEDILMEIGSQKPDLIVVAAYGKIIPLAVLEIPSFGVINVHPSLLPKYRGASPIQNAILNGEEKTGTTIMLMDKGVDTGDILRQAEVKIQEDETSKDLEKRLAKLSAQLLLEVIPPWIERAFCPIKQSHKEATLCQLIEKDDGKILWSEGARDIYNRFRALFSWPGIFTYWEDEGKNKRIKLKKISFSDDEPEAKCHLGEVIYFKEKIAVKTMKGVVFLEEVQIEGKDSVNIEDFLNGHQKFLGSILK